jgi:hypothetical protein
MAAILLMTTCKIEKIHKLPPLKPGGAEEAVATAVVVPVSRVVGLDRLADQAAALGPGPASQEGARGYEPGSDADAAGFLTECHESARSSPRKRRTVNLRFRPAFLLQPLQECPVFLVGR